MEKSLLLFNNSFSVGALASFFLHTEGGVGWVFFFKLPGDTNTSIHLPRTPLPFADWSCWSNWDCLLLHESFHSICPSGPTMWIVPHLTYTMFFLICMYL